MSRHAFGTVWNQGYMLPMHHGTNSGEAFPKRVPHDGCGFNGVPGDVPPEKALWYTRQPGGFVAGGSSLTRRGRDSGNVTMKSTGAFANLNGDRDALGHSASSPSLGGGMSAADAMISEANIRTALEKLPGNENSHAKLYYGRNRVQPETLRTAGVSTFKMRRFQETNTSIPFL
eukprot:gb/GFBE01043658.1/.p1 GENE.gb/GFBE01043658.1/~~gb/GFBE01043658.1/.p1  ORF type:complete len:174 (+),score=34.88 gb/GFBE01043658.1/:1-522(+)